MIETGQRIRSAATLLVLLLLLAACGGNGAANGTQDEGEALANQGTSAPQFALEDIHGDQISLTELAGQKVYVKYWASWCTICLAGMDELNELAGQDDGFQVITIVTPGYKGEQSEADFKEWFQGLQSDGTASNIRVLLDNGGKWAQQFGIRAFPTSLYIGSDGILVKSVPGHSANEAIIEQLNRIM